MRLPKLPGWVYITSFFIFSVTSLLHWLLAVTWDYLWFALGAVIGLHALEFIEGIVKPGDTILRSVISYAIVMILTFYVLTSTSWVMGKGVVLFMHLRYVLLQYEQLRQQKNLASWFQPFGVRLTTSGDSKYLYLVMALFTTQLFIFILV